MASKKKLAPAKERAARLLQAYAETCNLREACRQAKVSKTTHYDWLKRYPAEKFPRGYAAVFREFQERAGDSLESVAVERATTGWTEDVFYQGQKCGSVRRYSDGLLMQLLRGAKPQKYGTQKQELSGPQGAPVQARIEVVFVRPGDV